MRLGGTAVHHTAIIGRRETAFRLIFFRVRAHKMHGWRTSGRRVFPAHHAGVPAKLHNMPEDYTTPPPPPPPPVPPRPPYGQTPPYTAPYAYPPGSPGFGMTPPRRRSPWFYIGVIAVSRPPLF